MVHIQKIRLIATVLLLVESTTVLAQGFVETREIVNPTDYIAIPSEILAFNYAAPDSSSYTCCTSKQLEELARRNAELVCKVNGFDSVSSFETVSSHDLGNWGVKSRKEIKEGWFSPKVVERAPVGTFPWRYKFQKKIYENRVSEQMGYFDTGLSVVSVGANIGGAATGMTWLGGAVEGAVRVMTPILRFLVKRFSRKEETWKDIIKNYNSYSENDLENLTSKTAQQLRKLGHIEIIQRVKDEKGLVNLAERIQPAVFHSLICKRTLKKAPRGLGETTPAPAKAIPEIAISERKEPKFLAKLIHRMGWNHSKAVQAN